MATDFVDDWGYGANNGWEDAGGADGVREVSDGANGQGWDCANSGWGDNAPGGDANGSSHGKFVGGVDGRREFSGGGGFRREFSGGADVRRGFSGGVGGRREFSGGADGVREVSAGANGQGWDCANSGWGDNAPGGDANGSSHGQSVDGVDGRRGFSGGGGFRREFSGGADVRRGFSGGVDGRREFSGGADGRRGFSGGGGFRREFSGGAEVRREFSGGVGGRREFSGGDDGRREFSGGADGRRGFSGSADVRRGFSGSVGGRREFSGSANGRRIFSGSAHGRREFSGSADVRRGFSGGVDVRRGFERSNAGEIQSENEKPPVRPSKILFVDGIEDKRQNLRLLSVEEITEAFCNHVNTNVSIVDIARTKLPKRLNHHALVELGSVEEAHNAISKLDGMTLGSKHTLSVAFSFCCESRVPTNQQLIQMRKFKRSPEGKHDGEEGRSQEGSEEEAIDKENGDQSEKPVAPSSVNDDEMDVYSSCSSGDLPMTSQDFEDEIVAESADESTYDTKENDVGGGAKDKENGDQSEMPVAPSSVNEEEIDVYSSCSSGDLPMTSHDLEDEIVGESSDESTNGPKEDGDQTMRAGAVDYYGDDEMPVF